LQANLKEIAMKLARSLIFASMSVSTLAWAEEKTVTGLVDGMVITTSDSVANVEARAQSQGPGLCATKVSAEPGNTVAIAATPGVYSNWVTIASHVGSVSFTLHTTIDCDTGALFQVRYYRKK
jgi:hypothetical protein